MNPLLPFLVLSNPCGTALRWSRRRLEQMGLRVLKTFDLHAARYQLTDYPCPHHGTSQCDCQMVILLVYGESDQPITLVLHGSDGKTWLSLPENPSQQTNARTVSAIQEALS